MGEVDMNGQNMVIHFSEQEQTDLIGMSRWFKSIGFAILVMGVVAVILPHIVTLAVGMLVGIVSLVIHEQPKII